MKFSEWIKIQIDALRSIIVSDDPPPVPPDGVEESKSDPGIILRFQSSPANLSRVRKAIERFCENTRLDPAARDEVGLVVNEALANVIRHAYSNKSDQPIELRAEPFDSGLKLHIRDWGNGVDPTGKPRPPHDPLVPGGLGLMCMSRLMDDMHFVPQPDGMLLEMTRTTTASRASEVHRENSNDEIRVANQ
jgi:serine/threonine-protein kinase RsbW